MRKPAVQTSATYAMEAIDWQAVLRRLVAFGIFAALIIALIDFSFARIPLSMGLCVYGVILYLYPNAWLVVLPVLLPLLDLAPWSGRFFFDEFDFFVLLTLSVTLWISGRPLAAPFRVSSVLWSILLLLTISYAVSLAIGLTPLPPLDANAFSNYYSRYNSLRMSKGYFESLALAVFVACRSGGRPSMVNSLVAGMVLGLAGVTLAVVWERLIFTGLFDFASDFRVTATFSGLHNGGNDPEAYLVLAQPFLFAWVLRRRTRIAYLVGFGLFAVSTYALLMTFSRGGYLGLAVTWIVMFFCLLWRGARLSSYHSVVIGILCLAGAAAATIPVFEGSYVRARFASVREDWNYRLKQATNSFAVMDNNWQSHFFGMGLGRYPAIFYLRKPLPIRPASYAFEPEGNNRFLRLFPGSPLYFEQYVGVSSHSQYRLELKIRAPTRATIYVYVCEKNLLYSFRCAAPIRYNVESLDKWVEQNTTVNTGEIGRSSGLFGWISTRPVKFTLYAPGPESVDVDDVRFIDISGHNRIDNGNFSAGLDRWFFSTDDHLAWQIKDHWAHVYFEQGVLGVAAFLIFLIYLVTVLLSHVPKGDGFAAVSLASVLGFLTVGFFGFLFDTPRMLVLFAFVSLVGLIGISESSSAEQVSAAHE